MVGFRSRRCVMGLRSCSWLLLHLRGIGNTDVHELEGEVWRAVLAQYLAHLHRGGVVDALAQDG